MSEDRRNRIKFLAADRGLTIAELAVQCGLQPHNVRRYARQEAQPRLEIAEKIAVTLKVPVDEVLGTQLGVIPSPLSISSSNRRIPVYGAAQGGVGFDITDCREPVDSIVAPSYLEGSMNAYAVLVVGDSMQPRFYAGETLFVHPGLPVKHNDWVVLQLQAGDEHHALVKQYINTSNGDVVLRQLNPEKELKFKKTDVIALHKITGTKFT